MPGYSTDRAEDFYVDELRSASNTLTVTNRKKTPDSRGDGTMTSTVPTAPYEEDVSVLH